MVRPPGVSGRQRPARSSSCIGLQAFCIERSRHGPACPARPRICAPHGLCRGPADPPGASEPAMPRSGPPSLPRADSCLASPLPRHPAPWTGLAGDASRALALPVGLRHGGGGGVCCNRPCAVTRAEGAVSVAASRGRLAGRAGSRAAWRALGRDGGGGLLNVDPFLSDCGMAAAMGSAVTHPALSHGPKAEFSSPLRAAINRPLKKPGTRNGFLLWQLAAFGFVVFGAEDVRA